MTSITKAPKKRITHKGIKFVIRNTEKFETETFSLPSNQKFPEDHYEVKTFAIAGPIGCGKSTFAREYYGNRIKQIWGNNVDFYLARDLWATIDAVKNSKKLVHYLIIDDSIPMFDSRRSMSSDSVNMTQMFYEIRHELKKHSKQQGGNAGGLVIIALITQEFMAIDKRLRQALAFSVFKAYDTICDKMIPDQEIIKTLKKIKDKSVRVGDYFYRQLAVAVDCLDNYTLFYVDRKKLPHITFQYVTGVDIFERQRNLLIDYLIDNFTLQEHSKDALKAELHFEVDRMKSEENCRITKSDFSEIIIRAKRLQEIQLEPTVKKQQEEQSKHREELENQIIIKKTRQENKLMYYLVNQLDLKSLTTNDIRAEILFYIDRVIKSENVCYINKYGFPEIIMRALRIQKIKSEQKKIRNEKEKGSDGRTDISLLILHDIFGKSFREIAELMRTPKSTIHDRYSKEKKLQEKAIMALISEVVEIPI